MVVIYPYLSHYLQHFVIILITSQVELQFFFVKLPGTWSRFGQLLGWRDLSTFGRWVKCPDASSEISIFVPDAAFAEQFWSLSTGSSPSVKLPIDGIFFECTQSQFQDFAGRFAIESQQVMSKLQGLSVYALMYERRQRVHGWNCVKPRWPVVICGSQVHSLCRKKLLELKSILWTETYKKCAQCSKFLVTSDSTELLSRTWLELSHKSEHRDGIWR